MAAGYAVSSRHDWTVMISDGLKGSCSWRVHTTSSCPCTHPRPEPGLAITCTILAIAYWSSASRGAAARTLATCTSKALVQLGLRSKLNLGNGGVDLAGCPLFGICQGQQDQDSMGCNVKSTIGAHDQTASNMLAAVLLQ